MQVHARENRAPWETVHSPCARARRWWPRCLPSPPAQEAPDVEARITRADLVGRSSLGLAKPLPSVHRWKEWGLGHAAGNTSLPQETAAFYLNATTRRCCPSGLCAQRPQRPSQISSCVSSATPRFVQCSSGNELLTRMYITKFVECPVVDRTPRRLDTL